LGRFSRFGRVCVKNPGSREKDSRRTTAPKPPWRLLTALCALLWLSGATRAAELAGVTLADTWEVGGQSLTLNGMALGKKFIFKVYVVGLYLPEPAKEDRAVVEPDVPKVFVLQFLRSVGRERLVEAFKEGFEKTAGERGKAAQAEIERFLAVIKDVSKGDRITLLYEPGKGSTFTLVDEKGQTKEAETFEGKVFADAFLLLYVGPKPPKEEIKRGLLGKS
jgi:hypothetical protein